MAGEKITSLLKEYSESHQNPVNENIHWVCVPLIFFTIFGLLRSIPVPESMTQISPLFNWANLILVLALIYYLVLSVPLFIGFIFWALIVSLGNEFLFQTWGQPTFVLFSIGVFALAWVGQFIGHGFFEHKKPKFLKDLQFLLIGPAWLMNFILKVVKY